MPRTFERRTFRLDPDSIQVRAVDDKLGRLHFTGRAVVYGLLSEDLGGWQEIIEQGAATRTLAADPDVRFLQNHDANLLLARTRSGTLSLSEDDDGMPVDADMADVSYARDLAVLLDRGDINQMSFAFWVTSDSWSGNLHRVREFDLDGGDVSVVTFPAFAQTSAELRAAAERATGIPQRRFVDIYADDVRARLRAALMSRFAPAEMQWIWVRDFTDAEVVFELEGFDESGSFRLTYSLDESGLIVLADGEPEKVMPTTEYVPITRAADLLHRLSITSDVRAGKVLSSENQTLVQQAVEALGALLAKTADPDAEYSLERARHRLRELDLLSQI